MREAIQEEMKNVVQRAAVSNSGPDNMQFPVVQVNYYGGTQDCEVISPYGLYYMPPIGSLGVMFNINGESEYRAAVFNATSNRIRIDNPGECAFGSPAFGQKIYCNKDGDITVTCPNNMSVTVTQDYNVIISGDANIEATGNLTIKSPQITLDGNVIVTGTLTADGGATTISGGNFITSGDVTADGVSLKNHVHSGVTIGGGNTGAPV
jgi:hypothetical protein